VEAYSKFKKHSRTLAILKFHKWVTVLRKFKERVDINGGVLGSIREGDYLSVRAY